MGTFIGTVITHMKFNHGDVTKKMHGNHGDYLDHIKLHSNNGDARTVLKYTVTMVMLGPYKKTHSNHGDTRTIYHIKKIHSNHGDTRTI